MKKIFTFYIICFIFNNSFSQVGQWTWISGDSYIQSVGNYGIQGIADSANYPPAVYEPCEWLDQQGNFWVFGGFHNHTGVNGDMADLWKYNPNTNEWTWMKGSGIVQDTGSYGIMGVASPSNNPAGRGWGTPSWSDDNGNLWLYGGSSNSADLWKYNIATNEWTWMQGTPWTQSWNPISPNYGTFQVPSPTNTPGRRFEVTTSWTDANGNLWLFGGTSYDSAMGSSAFYNDMWKYDVLINQWIWMSGPNYSNDIGYYGIKGVASPLNRPAARNAYAKWKDPSGNFYLFGGLNFGPCGYQGFNDVWKYDINLNNWIWISGDSTINSSGSYSGECITLNSNIPRNAFENRSTCYDSLGNVFIFGSFGADCGTYTDNRNELWHYSTVHNLWTLLMQDKPVVWGTKGFPSPNNAPPKTFGSVAWYRNDEVWIFAGSDYGNSNSYNCLWKYSIDSSCFPSTINEEKNIYYFNLFPNPSASLITISLEIPTEVNFEIKIFNILGENLYEEIIKNVHGQFEKQISIENLKKGIYFLQVSLDDNNINRKFIKQ